MSLKGREVLISLCSGREVRGVVEEEDDEKLIVCSSGIKVLIFKRSIAAIFFVEKAPGRQDYI